MYSWANIHSILLSVSQQWPIRRSFCNHHSFAWTQLEALRWCTYTYDMSVFDLVQNKTIRTKQPLALHFTVELVHSYYEIMVKLVAVIVLLFLSTYFVIGTSGYSNRKLMERKRPKQTLASFLFHHLSSRFRTQGNRVKRKRPIRKVTSLKFSCREIQCQIIFWVC